jgi:hypothetical protein
VAVSGRYRGHRFRSLLELSFMVQKESEGYVLGESLHYETIRIPYRVGKRERTYVVDFSTSAPLAMWELTWSTRQGARHKVRKAAAARAFAAQHGMAYHVVTEKDVPRITLREAVRMPHVDLDLRSIRRLNRLRKKKV